MLIEHTLWGPRDKVQVAIERLRQFEPEAGYYLAFSGGKDSITIYRLAQMAGVKFDAHYNITTVDPPELVRFIKGQYPEVERHRPEMSMWRLMYKKHFPPLRQRRYCCDVLKEGGGSGRSVVTGVRWAESPRRKRRHLVETCFKDGTKTYINPVIDWLDEDVWEFIKTERISYCSLYDEGFPRLGCILCPMSAHPEKDAVRWPKYAAQYIRTFDKIIDWHLSRGKKMIWCSGEEMFAWWIKRNVKAQSKAQMVLFE